MTAEFVLPQQVRDYLRLEGELADDSRYGDPEIGSNIRAASSFLQRVTRRTFETSTGIRRFSTDGRALMPVPDLRAVNSVSLQEVSLEANVSYWLIPDPVEPTVYTGLQVRAFGSLDYRSNPQWFDRNLDRWPRGTAGFTLPNDLEVDADWGHDPLPEDLLHATRVLAGFYVKRPEAVLANVRITPEGAVLNYGELPLEVQEFLRIWSRHDQIVAAG